MPTELQAAHGSLYLHSFFFFFLHHIKSQVTGGEGVSSEGTELCIYDPDLPILTFFFSLWNVLQA